MGAPAEELLAWLGPAIGPNAFEVGPDVVDAFDHTAGAAEAFRPLRSGKWLGNLFELARARLHSLGLKQIYGGNLCTFSDPQRFFSHRRDKVTGRQAAFVWLVRESV
jgi:copper oxidase (laccase) domain-containing protein